MTYKPKYYQGLTTDVQAFIDALNGNGNGRFPLAEENGYVMANWHDEPIELETPVGMSAVPKPETEQYPGDALLLFHDIPQEEIDAFRAMYVTGKLDIVETIDRKIVEEEI